MGIAKQATPTAGTFVSTYRPIFIKFNVSGGTGNTKITYVPIEYDGGSQIYGDSMYLDADLASLGGIIAWTGNFQEWLKDDVTHQLNSMGTLASPTPTAFINTYGNRYRGQIYRADSVQLGGGVDTYAETIADTYFICNATLQHNEEQSLVPFTINQLPTGSSYRRFLTNAPYAHGNFSCKQYINLTESYFLSMIMNGEPDPISSNPLVLEIEEYDGVGNTYSTIEITYAGNFTFQAIFDIAVAPANLNEAVLATGVQPVIDANTVHYAFRLKCNSVNMSEVYCFTIDKRCQDNSRRFYFVNRLGSIDSHKFCGTENMNFMTEQITYKKNLAYVATSGEDVGYSFSKRSSGRVRLATDSREIYTTYSALLKNEQRIWLEEMLESPNVWTLETDEDGEYFYCPVNMLSGEFEIVNDEANLLQIAFQWSYANDIISQTN